MRVFVVLLLSVLLSAGAARATVPAPLPAAVLADAQPLTGDLRPLGSGEMRWFGLKIYDAVLWVPAGDEWSDNRPFALSIRYARNIDGEQLVETSIDEMRRMSFADETTLMRWRAALTLALPTVAEGETLVGLSLPGGGARFWHEGRPTAALTDPDLARAFFAIWLDSRTREPALRQRLLGFAQASR